MNRRSFLLKGATLVGAQLFSNVLPSIANELYIEGQWMELMRPLMGSYVSIALWDTDPKKATTLILECFSFIEKIIADISNWDERSATQKLNDRRALNFNDCPHFFVELLKCALTTQNITKGRFRSNCLPLTKLWKEAKAAGSVPTPSEIRWACSEVHNSMLYLDSKQVAVSHLGAIDLDGIGQGFIADVGCAYLKEHGASIARINSGGELKFLGNTNWAIEVEDPRSEEILGTAHVSGEWGVGTSGDYRDCWFVNGRRYHHLIDPETGMPGEWCQQATVLAPSCALADSLAGALFLMKTDDAIRLVSTMPDVSAILVDSRHQLHIAGKVVFNRA